MLLLPYLTDSPGVAAAVAGLIVFLPKAWDVVLNPIADRISNRSRSPRGRRGPFLLQAGVALAVTFALIFAGPAGPPALGGYRASTGGAVQSGSALTAIAVGATVVPAVLVAVSLLPLRRYSLDERTSHV